MPELKRCPFCGAPPESRGRPATPSEDVKHVWFLVCFCGGYSANAHRMGAGETPEEALADVAAAWNRRAIPAGQVLVPRELLAALLDGDSNLSLVAAQEIRGLLKESPE